jgi:hypothetical protein
MLEIENIYDSYKYSQARTMSRDWIGMRATAVSINRRAPTAEKPHSCSIFVFTKSRIGAGATFGDFARHVKASTCRCEEEANI